MMENPDRISKAVLERGLDAHTAFEIVSIDIADIDIGENIGARLQADQAEADTRKAQALAEQRRANAIAREQEMKAEVALNRARYFWPRRKCRGRWPTRFGKGTWKGFRGTGSTEKRLKKSAKLETTGSDLRIECAFEGVLNRLFCFIVQLGNQFPPPILIFEFNLRTSFTGFGGRRTSSFDPDGKLVLELSGGTSDQCGIVRFDPAGPVAIGG